MRILVTGSAGFVGFHLSRRLLAEGHEVVGLDGFTPYYDVALKRARHAILEAHATFEAAEIVLEDRAALDALVERTRPEVIVHLAAQAGVRYSLEHPEAYVSANMVGTFNLLEAARQHSPRHLMFASTSSVYGGSPDLPFREMEATAYPLSIYAATKRAGEAMTHSYSHLWGLPTTVFRFFTVYGPWGRPDMALFRFVAAIEAGEPIDIYNNGAMARDFTFIDDLVEAITRLMVKPPVVGQAATVEDSLSPVAPWRVVNIGRGAPVELMAFVEAVESATGKTAVRRLAEHQPGDMAVTFADGDLLEALTGYRPSTAIYDGVRAFVDWWREWKSVSG